jgi:GxxExxY protein
MIKILFMPEYKFGEITEKIFASSFKVHGTFGITEFEMPVYYLDQQIGARRVDLLVEEKISAELKAIINLEDVHIAQAMNYREAYNLEIGLLINLCSKRLQFHCLTNKEYNPLIVQHSIKSNSSHLSRFRQ